MGCCTYVSGRQQKNVEKRLQAKLTIPKEVFFPNMDLLSFCEQVFVYKLRRVDYFASCHSANAPVSYPLPTSKRDQDIKYVHLGSFTSHRFNMSTYLSTYLSPS